MHVLFVCTGNICRSPTAERLTCAFAAEHGLGLNASNAGTRAVIGYGMEPTAAEVLRSMGGDPEEFRARQLSPAIVGDADLILTMTTRHRDRVLSESPQAMRRTFTLLEAGRLLTVPVGAHTVAFALAVENFHALKQRQTSDGFAEPADKGSRVNLLNWDGKGRPGGMFPSSAAEE